VRRCGELGLNALIAQYGPALIDRAIIDAACRAAGVSFYSAMQSNLCGIAPAEFAPDLGDFDADAFLATLSPRDHIHARHTVGMVDPLTDADIAAGKRVGDGLPETLEEVSESAVFSSDGRDPSTKYMSKLPLSYTCETELSRSSRSKSSGVQRQNCG
jgi:hypothetical protein